MPFTKAQLIDLANQYARELDLRPVSESVFESWVYRKLLEPAKACGIKRAINPNWSYSDSAAERVKLILILQSMGATRNTQLLVCLSLLGATFPWHRVKKAMRLELRRIVKRQERGPPWWKDHYTDLGRLSQKERDRRIHQLPKLHPDLAASPFALSPEAYLQIGLRAYWGTENGLGITALVVGSVTGHQLKSSTAIPATSFMPIEIAGALGLPGESATDGYDGLDRLSPDDFEEARNLFACCAVLLVAIGILIDKWTGLAGTKTAVAYKEAASCFLTPEWMVPTAALFAVSAFNVRRAAK